MRLRRVMFIVTIKRQNEPAVETAPHHRQLIFLLANNCLRHLVLRLDISASETPESDWERLYYTDGDATARQCLGLTVRHFRNGRRFGRVAPQRKYRATPSTAVPSVAAAGRAIRPGGRSRSNPSGGLG